MADLEDTPEPVAPGIDLAEYVDAAGTEDDAYIAACALEAAGLVGNYIGKSAAVPDEVRRRAVLEVGADLYNRRSSRNGVIGFDGGEFAAPVRIARDPMLSAYPILRQYLTVGLA